MTESGATFFYSGIHWKPRRTHGGALNLPEFSAIELYLLCVRA
jgi:hypothetical protein